VCAVADDGCRVVLCCAALCFAALCSDALHCVALLQVRRRRYETSCCSTLGCGSSLARMAATQQRAVAVAVAVAGSGAAAAL
jgi:hypothetical protein